MSNEGWKCPVCGGGVAPGVERCPCVSTLPIVTAVVGTGVGSAGWTKPTDDGWIEWKGYGADASRPYPGNVRVMVKCADGSTSTGNANMFCWDAQTRPEVHIIAYKVLP